MAEREALLLSTQMLRVAAVKTSGVFFSTSAGGGGLEATPRLIILDGIIIRRSCPAPTVERETKPLPLPLPLPSIQEVCHVAFIVS